MEVCPNCQNKLKEIIYGTVLEMSDCYYGGCVSTPESPTHICIGCKRIFVDIEDRIKTAQSETQLDD